MYKSEYYWTKKNIIYELFQGFLNFLNYQENFTPYLRNNCRSTTRKQEKRRRVIISATLQLIIRVYISSSSSCCCTSRSGILGRLRSFFQFCRPLLLYQITLEIMYLLKCIRFSVNKTLWWSMELACMQSDLKKNSMLFFFPGCRLNGETVGKKIEFVLEKNNMPCTGLQYKYFRITLMFFFQTRLQNFMGVDCWNHQNCPKTTTSTKQYFINHNKVNKDFKYSQNPIIDHVLMIEIVINLDNYEGLLSFPHLVAAQV